MPPTRKRPSTRSPALARHDLGAQLREIVASRGLTAYAAARLAGLDPGVVSRFLSGERDIRLETAGRLAGALGLRLVELARRKRTAAPAPGRGPAPEDEVTPDSNPNPTAA